MASLDDLKKLPAEERLTRLKQLAEEREKEIKEAQALMKLSEQELKEEERLREKIPIPQMIAEREEQLETGEEREMFDAHRMRGGRRAEQKEKDEPTEQHMQHAAGETEEESLEHRVAREAPRPVAPAEVQYAAALHEARQPLTYEAGTPRAREGIYQAAQPPTLSTERELRTEYARREHTELERRAQGTPGSEAQSATASAQAGEKLKRAYQSRAGGEALVKQEHEFKEFEDEQTYQRGA